MSACNVDSIRTDGGTQPRATIDFDKVEEYAQDMGAGSVFPPPVVFFDGSSYWLADGFHRVHAAKVLGLAEIDCDIRQGDKRTAVLYSVGANATHGMRRTNEDKRRAVLTLLNDEEWRHWNDSEIARRCYVDHKTVTSLRPILGIPKIDEPRTVQRGTSVYSMNTARIGGASKPTIAAEPEYPTNDGPSPEPRPEWRPDTSHDYIWHALMEIGRQVDALPDPVFAAENFPKHLWHSLSVERAEEIADWLTSFASAWGAKANIRQEYHDKFMTAVRENVRGIAV